MAEGLFHTAKSYYIMKEIGYYNSHDDKYNGFNKTKIGKCKVNNKLKNFGFFKWCRLCESWKNKENSHEYIHNYALQC